MKKRALFLDRDGIINVDTKYLYKIEDFVFVDGIFELAKIFSQKGYMIFVVTNQSGIGRGYYSSDDFLHLSEWMVEKFSERDIKIDGVSFCPHLPDSGCACRKPKSGMVDEICKEHDIDLANSWMIGDKPSDMQMAINAGIGNTVFIDLNNYNSSYGFDSVAECKDFIEKEKDRILV